ncbi:peptide MFS transporter, partial [Flavobacteriales bacterium]|nr:peptide MFS transporter [Flavobacteriales bacterium]
MIQIISYILFTVLILIIVKNYLDKKGHPKALFYLFFAEMWERFSFYGMRALLVLYLIKDYYSQLENNEEIAIGIYASYGALVYLTPLIGGYLADKFIGYRKSIIFGGILMALGHFFMAFQSDFFFYGALGLLIIGNGFFKPNISTLVGSLYPEGDPRRDSGFTIFYMGINLGAMIAPLFCGFLGETYGWHYGFATAGVGMLAGLIVFWKGIQDGVLGEKGLQPVKYIGKKISGISVEKIVYLFGFLSVPFFAYLILLDTQSQILGSVLIGVLGVILVYLFYLIYDLKYNQKNNVDGDRLIAIIILSLFLTVFWGCFEIAGSAVTIWADKCVDLLGINASQTNAINPFYIVLLAIPFSWFWTKLDMSKRNPNTPVKFSLGLLQLGLGFLVFAFSIFYMGENGKVPILFLFLGYLFITTGELFLSPIGLSKVTQLAPKKIISFIMGVWFLSSTFAHYISGGIAKLTSKEFYNETSIITISDGESQNSYVFKMDFDFKNNIKGIKKITTYNADDKEYSF